MTYLSGRSKKNTPYTIYAVIALLFLCIVFFWPFVRKTLFSILEPVTSGYGNATHSFVMFPEFFTTYVTSRQSFIAKQKEQEQKIESLENELAEKDALLRENDLETSTSSGSLGRHSIVAYPILQDVTTIYSTILLSKGFKDGVTEGALVSLRGNQVVCQIKQVYTTTSLCALFTASGSTIEGVTSSSSITLSLVGRGGHYLADIARDTPITSGEIVYLRSNPAFVIGTVRSVANNNQDTSWHVFVEGAYSPVTSSIFYVQPQ